MKHTLFRLFFTVCLFSAIVVEALPDPKFPLKISANGRYFVDQTGRPFLWHADTPWELFSKISKDEALLYLDKRKAQGFTTIAVMLSPHTETSKSKAGGHTMFNPTNDITKPNMGYFDHAAWVVKEAEKRGIQVAILSLWFGCCKTNHHHFAPFLNDNNARTYGTFLGTHFKDNPNIFWLHGGDSSPIRNDNNLNFDKTNAVRELAAGIDATGAPHLQSYDGRPVGGTLATELSLSLFPGDTWLDFGMISSYTPYYQHFQDAYKITPVRPLVLSRSRLEETWQPWTPLRIRQQPYWALFAGAAGQTFGQEGVYQFGGKWKEKLETPGTKEMIYCKRLMDSRPWHLLEPDSDNTWLTAGQGKKGDLDFAVAALAKDGSFGFIYTSSKRVLKVDLTKHSGSKTDAFWFNPRAGTTQKIGTFDKVGSRDFTPPQGEDWVLVLDDASKGYSEPGGAPYTVSIARNISGGAAAAAAAAYPETGNARDGLGRKPENMGNTLFWERR